MRSLYLRIAAVFAIAFVFSLFSILWVSGKFWGRAVGGFFEATVSLEIQQAERAYERGGAPALKAYLTELDTALKGNRFFTDATG